MKIFFSFYCAFRVRFLLFVCRCYNVFQASAKSIEERYGSLNLLINASGILSIPNVLLPGISSQN